MRNRDKSIGIDAILLALYFSVTPMHQTLVLSNGSTVVKYLTLLVMVACLFWGYIQERRFVVIWDLIWPIALMFVWFALTILWTDSRSETLSSLIRIASYGALMLIVGSRRWTQAEKTLFVAVLILSCTLYSVQMIRSAATVRRSTLYYSVEGSAKEADQNAVASNVGIGALAAFAWFLQKKTYSIRWGALACVFIILAGIVSTGSRGGLIAFSAGAIYLFYHQTRLNAHVRNRVIIIACLLLIFYWLIFDVNVLQNEKLIARFKTTQLNSLNSRVEIWKQYLELLLHRPIGFLCGYGYGCDAIAHAAYMGRDWLRASHNDYLSILCEAGIPGLLLTGSFVHHIWRRSTQSHNLLGCSCVVLALISSLSINLFTTYGWWNAMILAYINVDSSAEACGLSRLPNGRQKTDTHSVL